MEINICYQHGKKVPVRDYIRALKIMSDLYFDMESDMGKETTIAVCCALKRQIPSTVHKMQLDAETTLHFCPTCGVRFIRWGFKHCGECGQALKWD